MSTDTTITPADLYAQIKDAFISDPSIEDALLKDFDATMGERFNVALPERGKLIRNGEGFKLTYAGKEYDIDDPRQAAVGELNDVELELVSGGAQDPCPAKGTFGIAKPGWMKPNL